MHPVCDNEVLSLFCTCTNSLSLSLSLSLCDCSSGKFKQLMFNDLQSRACEDLSGNMLKRQCIKN